MGACTHEALLDLCMALACRRVCFKCLLLSAQRHEPACICTSVTFRYCCCCCACMCVCVFQNAGLLGGTKETAGPVGNSSLASWGEWELHRLVAHFLAARFPILLALNKVSQGCCILHVVLVSCHDGGLNCRSLPMHALQQHCRQFRWAACG